MTTSNERTRSRFAIPSAGRPRAALAVVLPVLSALALALAAPTAARAQDSMSTSPPSESSPSSSAGASFAPVAAAGGGFGAVGQWVLSVSTANDSSTSVFLHKASGGGWELNLHPALDYFIANNVSVGGVVGFDYQSGGDTTLDFGARAGFDLNISEHLGWWPTGGIFVQHFSNADHTSGTPTSLGIFAPFLYHPFPHVFAGLGPSFNFGLNDGNGKEFGIDFMLGGWL